MIYYWIDTRHATSNRFIEALDKIRERTIIDDIKHSQTAEYRILDEYPSEPYTDVYLIKYREIESAKLAKNKLDNHYFFSKDLHVCYAPEFESVQDTREKLNRRRTKIRKYKKKNTRSSTRQSALPPTLPPSSHPHSTIDSVPITVPRPPLLHVPSHQSSPVIEIPPPPPPSHLTPSPSHHLIPLLPHTQVSSLPPLPPPPPPHPFLPRPSIIVPHIGHASPSSPLLGPPLHVPPPHTHRLPIHDPSHGPVPFHDPPHGAGPLYGPTHLPIPPPPSHGPPYVQPLIGTSPGTHPIISPSPPPLMHTSSSSNHIQKERGILVPPTKRGAPLLHNPPNSRPLTTCTGNMSSLTPPPLISIASTVQPPPLVSDCVHVPVSLSSSKTRPLLRPPLHNDHHPQSQCSTVSRHSVRPPFTSSTQTGKDQLTLTGHPSVDLTILSVRNKMSQVFNTNAARDYAPPQPKKRRRI